MEFVGQIVGRNGITTFPNKISVISTVPSSKDIRELRRFMGMVNQLGKCLPTLSDLTEPLRDLLNSKNTWSWGEAQTKGLNRVKDMLTRYLILALYDAKLTTKVTTDLVIFSARSSHYAGVPRKTETSSVCISYTIVSRNTIPINRERNMCYTF